MSDYECASINAIKIIFPNIINSACFFHLMQSFRRQADSHGLKSDLNENDTLAYQFKKLKLVYLKAFIKFILGQFLLFRLRMLSMYGRSLFHLIPYMMAPYLQLSTGSNDPT